MRRGLPALGPRPVRQRLGAARGRRGPALVGVGAASDLGEGTYRATGMSREGWRMNTETRRALGWGGSSCVARQHRFSMVPIVVLAVVIAFATLTGQWEQVVAQESAPLLKVDLVVPADVTEDDRAVTPTDLCVYLPPEATTVSVSRRPLVPEAGGDRPLWMTIRPYVSTAFPLVERANVIASMMLTIPELGHETCFSFENRVFPREAQVAQAYKYFAQVVSVEVR